MIDCVFNACRRDFPARTQRRPDIIGTRAENNSCQGGFSVTSSELSPSSAANLSDLEMPSEHLCRLKFL